MDTGHILEERAIMLGKSQAELHAPLPSHYGHKLHSRLKTILYYDPNWQKPSGRFVDGRWTRYYAGSTNPGVWPEIWQFTPKKDKEKTIEQFKQMKRGVYADGDNSMI